MSVAIYGIRNGKRDLLGMAPGPDHLLKFAYHLHEMLVRYPEGLMVDSAKQPEGLSIWVVYDHPADWPSFYVAREWISEHKTGNMVLDRDLDRLRDHLLHAGKVKLLPMEGDDPLILETWL